jgi:hypothetical protein
MKTAFPVAEGMDRCIPKPDVGSIIIVIIIVFFASKNCRYVGKLGRFR